MSPRTGRPKSENPKDGFVGVRLDQETLQKLDETARIKDVSRSEIIREGIERIYSDTKK